MLAKKILEQSCLKCYEESFEEINDIKRFEYSEHLSRSEDPILQNNIKNEIIKAKQLFNNLFQIRINH